MFGLSWNQLRLVTLESIADKSNGRRNEMKFEFLESISTIVSSRLGEFLPSLSLTFVYLLFITLLCCVFDGYITRSLGFPVSCH